MMDIQELYDKPLDYKFTQSEIDEIKKKVPKRRFVAKYAFYNKHSSKGRYIVFIIDRMPFATRRSAVENYWKYVCERKLSTEEYDYEIKTFGTNHQRFMVWYYDCIEKLIEDDKNCGVKTPIEFIKAAKAKGYSKSIQLRLNLK